MSQATPTRTRTLSGRVVSDKMDKTVTVLVERRAKHPIYGKVMTLSKKYHAHDEDNTTAIGDQVEISASRPVSRSKTWRVSRMLKKAEQI